MPEYITQHPLEHDGQRYEQGQTVELDDGAANALLAAGALLPPVAAPSMEGREPSRPKAGEMIALVKAAGSIQELEALAAGEDRKSVLEAIASRRADLAGE